MYLHNTNPDSRLFKNMYKQIILQHNIFVNLNHKMSLICEISNEKQTHD